MTQCNDTAPRPVTGPFTRHTLGKVSTDPSDQLPERLRALVGVAEVAELLGVSPSAGGHADTWEGISRSGHPSDSG